ncbi:MAG: ketopantoate reductase family protein [Rhizobiaceae bacterium]
MRVAIFGAGAIGGLVGAALHRAGAEVGIVARGAHLEAIRKEGLSVAIDAETWTARLHASDEPADLGPRDLVVVAVKAPSLPAVADSIGPLLNAGTAVAFLMNGVPWWYFHGHGGPDEGRRLPLIDPGGAVWNAVGPERVIGGVVRCAAIVEMPGRIRVTGTVRRILLGRPDNNSDAHLQECRDLLAAGGIEAATVPDIRDAIWDKLVGNLMDGPLAILTGARSDILFTDEGCIALARTIGHEAIAIGRAMGRKNSVDVDQAVQSGRGRVHLPSIAQDLQRGRPMEIDALMSVPLAFAAERSVVMPMLDAVVAMAKLRARAAGLY